MVYLNHFMWPRSTHWQHKSSLLYPIYIFHLSMFKLWYPKATSNPFFHLHLGFPILFLSPLLKGKLLWVFLHSSSHVWTILVSYLSQTVIKTTLTLLLLIWWMNIIYNSLLMINNNNKDNSSTILFLSYLFTISHSNKVVPETDEERPHSFTLTPIL